MALGQKLSDIRDADQQLADERLSGLLSVPPILRDILTLYDGHAWTAIIPPDTVYDISSLDESVFNSSQHTERCRARPFSDKQSDRFSKTVLADHEKDISKGGWSTMLYLTGCRM